MCRARVLQWDERMTIATLTATKIGKRFGALSVLEGIDFAVTSAEAVGVVGPNGAG